MRDIESRFSYVFENRSRPRHRQWTGGLRTMQHRVRQSAAGQTVSRSELHNNGHFASAVVTDAALEEVFAPAFATGGPSTRSRSIEFFDIEGKDA